MSATLGPPLAAEQLGYTTLPHPLPRNKLLLQARSNAVGSAMPALQLGPLKKLKAHVVWYMFTTASRRKPNIV